MLRLAMRLSVLLWALGWVLLWAYESALALVPVMAIVLVQR